MQGPNGRIIVGVSGSLSSLAALRLAVGHARRTTGAMDAVLAWAPPGGETGPKVATPKVLVDLWTEMAAQRLRQAFDEALGGIPTDIDVRLHVVRGDPGKVLTCLAHRPDDLLVIGAGSAGAIRRRLHRTVGGYCTAHAGCPVILAPPPALARALGTHGTVPGSAVNWRRPGR
jgi:nucleotide-binding universal stress UspA family protein